MIVDDLQPLLGTADISGTNAGKAVTRKVVRIDRGKQQVGRVDVKRLTTKLHRNDSGGGARNDETALAVALRSWDLGVDGSSVGSRGDNESGTGVEDGGAALESEICTINRCGEITLPETVRVDVLEGNEGLGVDLGLVDTTERDLAIVETVGNSGDLVRRDGIGDQPILSERLDGGRDGLVREGGLGEAHQTIELGGVTGEIHRFHKSNAKDVFIQSQTSDVDIIRDDVSLHLARAICNLEGVSGVLEAG